MLCPGAPGRGPWSERNPGEASGSEAASSRLAERHVSEGLQEGHAVLLDQRSTTGVQPSPGSESISPAPGLPGRERVGSWLCPGAVPWVGGRGVQPQPGFSWGSKGGREEEEADAKTTLPRAALGRLSPGRGREDLHPGKPQATSALGARLSEPRGAQGLEVTGSRVGGQSICASVSPAPWFPQT